MTDPAYTCAECSTKHSRLLPADLRDPFQSAAERVDPHCSDECRDGAEVRKALGQGGRCTSCTTWSSKPIRPVHEFGTMYCRVECMPSHLRTRENHRW